MCTHGDKYEYATGLLSNKYVKLSAEQCSNPYMLGNFAVLSADLYRYLCSKTITTGIPPETQKHVVSIQISSEVLSGPIWFLTVYEVYQQTNKVATYRERVKPRNKGIHRELLYAINGQKSGNKTIKR